MRQPAELVLVEEAAVGVAEVDLVALVERAVPQLGELLDRLRLEPLRRDAHVVGAGHAGGKRELRNFAPRIARTAIGTAKTPGEPRAFAPR